MMKADQLTLSNLKLKFMVERKLLDSVELYYSNSLLKEIMSFLQYLSATSRSLFVLLAEELTFSYL